MKWKCILFVAKCLYIHMSISPMALFYFANQIISLLIIATKRSLSCYCISCLSLRFRDSCPTKSRDNPASIDVSGPSFFFRQGDIKGGYPRGTSTPPLTPSMSSVAPLGNIASKLNGGEPIVCRDFAFFPELPPLETSSEPADGGKSHHTPDPSAFPGSRVAPGAHEMSRTPGCLHSGSATPPAHTGDLSLTTSTLPVSPAHAAPSSFPYDNFLSPTRNESKRENYWEPLAAISSLQQLLQSENADLDGF